MPSLVDHNPNLLRAGIKLQANAVQMPLNGQTRLQASQQMSFANQFAQIKHEAASERDLEQMAQMPQFAQEQESKPSTEFKTGIFSNLNTKLEDQSTETILKSLKREEYRREQDLKAASETEKHSSRELAQTLSDSETVRATNVQAHQAEVHDAVREGNVAEREAQQHNGNDRKKQLANWEDLAPRITEDIKNRAVRIDIPGLNDIETLIVRMQKNQVTVQVVGDGKVMDALQSREAELKSRLASKNIQLADFQAFDARRLNKRKVA